MTKKSKDCKKENDVQNHSFDVSIRHYLKGGETMKKRLKLKQLRVGLDMSQEQMADSLGVSRSTYAAIENGQRYGTLKFWKTLEVTHNVPHAEVYEIMTEIEF